MKVLMTFIAGIIDIFRKTGTSKKVYFIIFIWQVFYGKYHAEIKGIFSDSIWGVSQGKEDVWMDVGGCKGREEGEVQSRLLHREHRRVQKEETWTRTPPSFRKRPASEGYGSSPPLLR